MINVSAVDTNNLHNAFGQFHYFSSILLVAVVRFCVGKCLAEHSAIFEKKNAPSKLNKKNSSSCLEGMFQQLMHRW